MSSFPLGGEPPDRFFYALGRVSFEAENMSASLDVLLQVLTQIQDMSILTALVGGEPLIRKIEKCVHALEASSVFGTEDASELRSILNGLNALVGDRNRYIHAAWSYYNEKLRTAHATRVRRSGPEDIVASIGQIEELADSFVEADEKLLTIIESPYFNLIQWASVMSRSAVPRS